MNSEEVRLLTLISYPFIPATSGGHIAHVHIHNYLSKIIENHVAGSSKNELAKSKEPIFFYFHPVFKKISPYLPLSYLFSLIKLVKKENINTIMCSHPYLGITAFVLSKWTGAKLVSYSHNIESERFRTLGKWWWKLLFYYEKWVLSVSALTFFVTKEDRDWAIQNYHLMPENCCVSPFGINLSEPPKKSSERVEAFRKKYKTKENENIIYFAGAYNYPPNDQAVLDIVEQIYPRLESKSLDYKIFIVGKGLSSAIQAKIATTQGKVNYIGFIEDIRDILDSADLMLNPMLSGGGIKTKAVEALGNNITVVSTANGAAGLEASVCGEKLLISTDKDWDTFTEQMVQSLHQKINIPPSFYEFYYWGAVTERVVEEIKKITS